MKRSWIMGAIFALGVSLAGCQLGPGDYIIVSVNGGASILIVAGNVTQGPIAPVATEDSPNEAPLKGAHVRIETTKGVRVAEAVSDANGRFSVQLAPGTYRFVPLPTSTSPFPEPPPAVELTIDRTRDDLSFSYDTGIR
jgi:hypothetical protein